MTVPASRTEAYEERLQKVDDDVYTATLEEQEDGRWRAFVEAPDNVRFRYGKWGTHYRRGFLTLWGAKRWARKFVAHERAERRRELRDEYNRMNTKIEETL